MMRLLLRDDDGKVGEVAKGVHLPSRATRVASRRASFIRGASPAVTYGLAERRDAMIIPPCRYRTHLTLSTIAFGSLYGRSVPFAAHARRPALSSKFWSAFDREFIFHARPPYPLQRERERERGSHETSVPAARETRSSIFQIKWRASANESSSLKPRDEKDRHGVTLHGRKGYRRKIGCA